MEDKEGNTENNNPDIVQGTAQRLRLDSYVNIENDEIPKENKHDQERTPKEDNKKRDRSKSLSDLFPCGVCGDDLGKRYKGKSVLCMGCMHWCHLTKCSGLSNEKEYKNREYRCPTCVKECSGSQPNVDTDSSLKQKESDSKKDDVNRNDIETKKAAGRRVTFHENAPIITGGREFPEARKKRKNREETPESPEKKTDEEKSPISKKTKIGAKKKSEKINNDTLQKNDKTSLDDQKLKCIDCCQMYSTDNNTEIKCIGCNAGKHDCLKDTNNKKEAKGKTSKGSVWMCGDCMENFQITNNKIKIDTVIENVINANEQGKKQPAEKNTNTENVLEYQGTNITLKDIKTLDNEQWVCDEIIALFLAFMREDPTLNDKKVLLVNPATAFLLKEFEDKKSVQDLKVELRINEMEWIFYPINDNLKADKVGGTHWSLLMFCKRENKYYHYDPIVGKNTEHAKKLVMNIIDISNFGTKGLPEYKDIICPQQENSFDCGPYIMLYIQELINNIITQKEGNRFYINREDATKFRKQLQDIIHYRISKTDIVEIPIIKEKTTNNDKPFEHRKMKICNKWDRNVCYNIEDCLYDHPTLCKHWVNGGECRGWKNKQCAFYHPALCWQFLGQGKCKNGNRCRFRHINKFKENRSTYNQSDNKYRREVCRYWAAGNCLKENCNFSHPEICRYILRVGKCNNRQCTEFHPQICEASMNNERCKWGDRCRLRHLKTTEMYRDSQRVNPHQYSKIQKYNIGIDVDNYVGMNHGNTEYGTQLKTNTEDFLWARLSVWEKRQMIGMMTHTIEKMPRK